MSKSLFDAVRHRVLVRGTWRAAKLAAVAVTAVVFGLASFVTSAEASVSLLDGASWATGTTAVPAPTTYTYTAPAGDDRAVVVHISGEGTGAISGVTIGGVAATPIASNQSGNAFCASYYRLIGSSGGTTSANIVVTWSTQPATGGAITAATYGGVLQSAGTGAGTAVNTFGANGTAAAGAATVTGITVEQNGSDVGLVVYQLAENTGVVGAISTTGSWTFTQRYSAVPTSYGSSGGDSDNIAGGPFNVTSTTTQNRQAFVVYSLSPASSCSDSDPATILITNPTTSDTVGGTVTVQAQVGTETDPSGSMSSMLINIGGSTGCNVTDGSMTWNGATSRYEYTWDTSACGTGAPDGGVTIDVSGVDDDCSTAVNATQVTNVTIDNTCVPGTMTAPSGSVVSGNPLDMCSTIALTSGASVTNVFIYEGGSGPDYDEQEYFDSADDVCDYSNWSSSSEPTANCGGPFDAGTAGGLLYVFNSSQSTENTNNTFTGSAGTGPTSLHSGTTSAVPPGTGTPGETGGFLFLENSGSPPFADSFFTRNATFDASTYEAHISFASAQYNLSEGGGLRFQVNSGSGWTTEWEQINNDGNNGAWTEVDINLFAGTVSIDGGAAVATTSYGGTGTAYTSGNLQYRFVFASGTTWGNDVAVDTIRVYGPVQQTVLYDGASCSGIDTTGWTSGIKNVDLTGADGCGGPALNDSGTIDFNACTDTDLATLNTTAPTSGSTVNGNSVLIQTQVGNEPGANMTGMAVTIAGSSSCNVTDAAMTWNGTSSRWEYIWDTSACGTGAAETGITIDVSGVEPDCSTPTINAAQITNITIDNTCTPGSITYDGGVPNPITTATFDFTPYITLTNGSGSTVSNAMYSVNGDTWTSVATPYTLPAKTAATINVRFKADDTCSGTLYDDNGANDGTGPGYAMNIDTRIDPIEPVSQTITQTGLTGFTVRLVYCNDKNGNATFRVDYKLSSSGTWTNGTPISDGGAGDLDGLTDEEVSIAISGLVEGETYDIRMTYIDDTDGVIGTAEYIETKTLVAWVDDPLLHNALRFACDKSGYWDQTSCEGAGGVWTLDRKWATGWGTTGGEYGPIRCNTCHDKGTGNVKRVNNTITSSSGNFPGSAVTLTTVEDGTSDFGDDAGDHATSNKICEVCHTQTNYHRYDTTGQTGGTDHYNQADCIKCHEHKIGFRASCDACHASPPLDAGGLVTTDPTGSTTPGEHNVHVNTLGYTDCNTCHNGWQSNGEMPKSGEINIGFVTPGADGGIYNGRIGGGGYYNAGTLTTINTTDAMTCANYCHGYGTPQWNPTATADCGACHGKVGSFGDERAGAPTGGTSLDLSGVGTGTKVGKHANHLDDSVAETGDPCALCHFGTLYSDSTHVDGTVNVLLRQAAKTGDNSTGGAGTSAVFTPGATGRCSSLECHNDADWDSTVSGGCDFCHGYPPNSTNNSHATGVRPVDHDSLNILPNHGDCQFCHGYKNNGSDQLAFVDPATLGGIYTPVAGDHEDGATTMNGNTNGNATDDAGYNESNGGCSTTACHGNDATHQLTLPGAPAADVQLRDIGPGKCTSCHDGTDTNAPVVTLASTHTKVLKTDGTGSDCTVCHSGHYAGGTGVQIPNNTKVGINYAAAGHGGIMLGGTETTINATIRGLTTEAQVCWGCHDLAANTVSEWGVNQQAATGNLSYNYGTLSGSNWTTATWYSGKGATVSDPFWYKRGSIQSIHSTSTPGAGTNDGKGLATGSDYAKTEPIETAAAIRCSYCHDVHELAQASGDTKAGKPYLRGTWQGNIYPEDGAPLSGMTNWIQVPMGSANSSYMNVPRASASTTNTGTTGQANLGAYWIDQNNPNHNLNTLDADSFAGLCELCHGDGDGSWFTTASVANNEIDSIDQYTGENLWVSGNNGHLNVVKGASGTTATAHNIFDTSRRGSAQIEDRTSTRPNPYLDMGASSITARGYSWRETGEGGFGYQPLMTDPEPEAWRIFQWDLSGSINTGTATLVVDGGTFSYQDGTATAQSETTQKNYHTFTCAKCHNPHASRLPKLMITNCLDTKQNTWDENHTSQATNAAAAEWQNSYASQWPAAQNCHRLDERAPSSTTWGQGWNTVTPW